MLMGLLRETCGRFRWFIAAIVIGVLVRGILAPLGWHAYDMFTYADWAWQLLEEPRSRFYAAPLEVPGDHLPGDLSIMWVMAHVTHLIAPNLDYFDNRYVLVMKSVPILCDMVLAIGVLVIGRMCTTERRAIMIASAMALNPASIVISAVWGQWDSASMSLVVFAVYAALRRKVWMAYPLLACACLFKPQLGVLIPLFVIADLRMRIPPMPSTIRLSAWHVAARQACPGWVLGGATSIGLVLAICLPFGVGFPGMATRYSLSERIHYALDRYESSSHGAYNLWYLLFPEARWDGEVVAFGLTYHDVGMVHVGIAVVLAVVGALVIDPWPIAVVWGGVIATLAIYMLPTRVHERYLFPAVVLSFLLWIVVPRMKWLAIGLSATTFIGVYLSYSWYKPSIDIALLQHSAALRTIAISNLVLFGTALTWGLREALRSHRRAVNGQRLEPADLHGAESWS